MASLVAATWPATLGVGAGLEIAKLRAAVRRGRLNSTDTWASNEDAGLVGVEALDVDADGRAGICRDGTALGVDPAVRQALREFDDQYAREQ
jgi:hypothetical protein